MIKLYNVELCRQTRNLSVPWLDNHPLPIMTTSDIQRKKAATYQLRYRAEQRQRQRISAIVALIPIGRGAEQLSTTEEQAVFFDQRHSALCMDRQRFKLHKLAEDQPLVQLFALQL